MSVSALCECGRPRRASELHRGPVSHALPQQPYLGFDDVIVPVDLEHVAAVAGDGAAGAIEVLQTGTLHSGISHQQLDTIESLAGVMHAAGGEAMRTRGPSGTTENENESQLNIQISAANSAPRAGGKISEQFYTDSDTNFTLLIFNTLSAFFNFHSEQSSRSMKRTLIGRSPTLS